MIEIRETAFDPFREIQQFEAAMGQSGKVGAMANFIGKMRDHNEGNDVIGMTLEHYPGMTEKHLHAICENARSQWEILDVLLLHRIGEISINDSIVLVAVWSAHRKDAFEACRFIMEDLKSKAPFWKKETLKEGERWVESNTPGY